MDTGAPVPRPNDLWLYPGRVRAQMVGDAAPRGMEGDIEMMEPRPTKDQLMAALDRLEKRKRAAIAAAVVWQGSVALPRPSVRWALRNWFGKREALINQLWRGWE